MDKSINDINVNILLDCNAFDYILEKISLIKDLNLKFYYIWSQEIELEKISDLNKALLEIQKIDRVSITRADIEEVIHFLNAQKSDGDYHFEFYQKEELDILLEKTVRNVLTFAQK